jgi:predicted PurR-regulated permease PerM
MSEQTQGSAPTDSSVSSTDWPAGGPSRLLQTVYRTPPRWVRPLVIWIFLGVLGYRILLWGFHGLSSLIGILFLAWLLSIAMEPAVGRLTGRGMKRGLATGIVMLTLALLAVVFFAVFGRLLIDQLVQLIRSLPSSIDQVITWVNATFNTNWNEQSIQDALQIDNNKLLSLASNLGGGVFGIVTSLVSLIFSGFTLLLFAYYMSADAPRLRATVSSWFPPQQQQVIDTVWSITVAKTGGYVFSRLILAVICAFFTGIFLLVLGVPFWIPLAIWTGLVSQFIPTIGTYLGGALPAIIAALNSPFKGLLVIGFVVVYQQVENYFFSPKVTSRTVDIHPAVAFGAVIGGGALFGPWGALVAIPIVAAVQSVAETYGRRYELISGGPQGAQEESAEPASAGAPVPASGGPQPGQATAEQEP